MNARDRLRRYLEQRRELGESEFLLDSMTVEDALQTLGAIRNGSGTRRAVVKDAGSAADSAASEQRAGQPTSKAEQERAPRVDETTRVNPMASASEASDTELALPEQPGKTRSEAEQASPAKPASARTDIPAPHEDVSQDMARTRGKAATASKRSVSKDEDTIKHLGSIAAIAQMVSECTRCILYKTATNPVPGEGNVKADLVCVGEAPGANEDASGRPFVGAAGQLLTKILAAIDIKREDVFICNVLKHRPPGNRNPLPDEVAACSPYLVRQIELIRPKVIVAFGTFAAHTLLATKTPIGKLRGTVHTYHGVPLVVTYHPAALLRNPAWKRPTWEDVKLARQVLDNAQ